jgi:hypothetical protein
MTKEDTKFLELQAVTSVLKFHTCNSFNFKTNMPKSHVLFPFSKKKDV